MARLVQLHEQIHEQLHNSNSQLLHIHMSNSKTGDPREQHNQKLNHNTMFVAQIPNLCAAKPWQLHRPRAVGRPCRPNAGKAMSRRRPAPGLDGSLFPVCVATAPSDGISPASTQACTAPASLFIWLVADGWC
jgi:hypothetical protein